MSIPSPSFDSHTSDSHTSDSHTSNQLASDTLAQEASKNQASVSEEHLSSKSSQPQPRQGSATMPESYANGQVPGATAESTAARRSPRLPMLLAVAILAIATFSILPNYVTGQWAWNTPAPLLQTSQLNQLQNEGLSLSGWLTQEQQTVSISGLDWSIQSVVPTAENTVDVDRDRPIIVMLRPQTWYQDQPQVEWMDINGAQRWTADHHQALFVKGEARSPQDRKAHPVSFRTRFFRGWSRQQTYAVVQWYAWTTGGSPEVSDWFWADQLQQLRDREHMPWVAVSVLIPIKPLGNIDTARPTATTLSQMIQAALIRDVFSKPT